MLNNSLATQLGLLKKSRLWLMAGASVLLPYLRDKPDVFRASEFFSANQTAHLKTRSGLHASPAV